MTMTTAVLIAVAVVAGMGLLIGLVLSIASIVMAVPKNKTAEAIVEVLPGANCGACGFSGCAGYAEALANGDAEIGLCTPGGESCANFIAVILGVEAKSMEKKIAVVRCNGTAEHTDNKAQYIGIDSCAAAKNIGGGLSKCAYACLGFGDCVKVCPYDAIEIKDGVAKVDEERCKACSLCVKTCPRGVIELVTVKDAALVRCSNHDKGAVAMKACQTGCIGCKKCEKVCPSDAIKVENFLAKVDEKKCSGCAQCIDACPRGCIGYLNVFEQQPASAETAER